MGHLCMGLNVPYINVLIATNALQAAMVAGCAEDGAHAVQVAVDRKLRFYAARCEAEGLAYMPVAIDTFGGWHSLALETITRVLQNFPKLESDQKNKKFIIHMIFKVTRVFLKSQNCILGCAQACFISTL